ncbi:MAG: hypothetical protein CMH62_02815 [Nanoarchaeota archaeon]|nr:hypothetical protein [Nanoarchaeota archaeon]|tara:strand:+ start:1009 stop:1236 length:228 start_codon:yes stop_codon:yes gene_type:complete
MITVSNAQERPDLGERISAAGFGLAGVCFSPVYGLGCVAGLLRDGDVGKFNGRCEDYYEFMKITAEVVMGKKYSF